MYHQRRFFGRGGAGDNSSLNDNPGNPHDAFDSKDDDDLDDVDLLKGIFLRQTSTTTNKNNGGVLSEAIDIDVGALQSPSVLTSEELEDQFTQITLLYSPVTYAYVTFDCCEIYWKLLSSGLCSAQHVNQFASRWFQNPLSVLKHPTLLKSWFGEQRYDAVEQVLTLMLAEQDALWRDAVRDYHRHNHHHGTPSSSSSSSGAIIKANSNYSRRSSFAFLSPIQAIVAHYGLDAEVWVPFLRVAPYCSALDPVTSDIFEEIVKGMLEGRCGKGLVQLSQQLQNSSSASTTPPIHNLSPTDTSKNNNNQTATQQQQLSIIVADLLAASAEEFGSESLLSVSMSIRRHIITTPSHNQIYDDDDGTSTTIPPTTAQLLPPSSRLRSTYADQQRSLSVLQRAARRKLDWSLRLSGEVGDAVQSWCISYYPQMLIDRQQNVGDKGDDKSCGGSEENNDPVVQRILSPLQHILHRSARSQYYSDTILSEHGIAAASDLLNDNNNNRAAQSDEDDEDLLESGEEEDIEAALDSFPLHSGHEEVTDATNEDGDVSSSNSPMQDEITSDIVAEDNIQLPPTSGKKRSRVSWESTTTATKLTPITTTSKQSSPFEERLHDDSPPSNDNDPSVLFRGVPRSKNAAWRPSSAATILKLSKILDRDTINELIAASQFAIGNGVQKGIDGELTNKPFNMEEDDHDQFSDGAGDTSSSLSTTNLHHGESNFALQRLKRQTKKMEGRRAAAKISTTTDK